MTLDDEEREILDLYESDKLVRAKEAEELIQQHQRAAAALTSQDQRFNVVLSVRDMHVLQANALRQGLSYQALAASILHKYVEGRLIEKR